MNLHVWMVLLLDHCLMVYGHELLFLKGTPMVEPEETSPEFWMLQTWQSGFKRDP